MPVLTGFSNTDMLVYLDDGNSAGSNLENIAFGIQAISWEKTRNEKKFIGSLVVNWAPNPTNGPHNIVIEYHGEEGERWFEVIYGVEILDKDNGEYVDWEDVELAKVYCFLAAGTTGILK